VRRRGKPGLAGGVSPVCDGCMKQPPAIQQLMRIANGRATVISAKSILDESVRHARGTCELTLACLRHVSLFESVI
jgi:hypothetical protein